MLYQLITVLRLVDDPTDIDKVLSLCITLDFWELRDHILDDEEWFEKLTAPTHDIKEQILRIRDSGLTNMFASNAVQALAFSLQFYELVNFIYEDHDSYVNFILTGTFLDYSSTEEQ